LTGLIFLLCLIFPQSFFNLPKKDMKNIPAPAISTHTFFQEDFAGGTVAVPSFP